MAKRYKEEPTEQQETDFKMPAFDEEKYIQRERRNIKTIFISFILGVVIAIISVGFWVLLTGSFLRWELILLLGVFNMPWLRYLFSRLHIDLDGFGRRGWLTAYGTYFFTWLLILIVLVNPPFYDGESPQIQVAVLPGFQSPGGTVMIVASVADNVQISSVSFTYTDPQGISNSPPVTLQNGMIQFTYDQNTSLLGQYNFTISATDPSGHRTTVTGNFTYSADALSVISSRSTDLTSGDTITIKADRRISSENFRVYYRLDDGREINATRRTASDTERYETTPEVSGWVQNSTTSLQLYAEVSHYFLNNPTRYSNNVTASQPFPFSTGADKNIGTATDPTPNYPLPASVIQSATPGFEILIALGALAVVVLVIRKKKQGQ